MAIQGHTWCDSVVQPCHKGSYDMLVSRFILCAVFFVPCAVAMLALAEGEGEPLVCEVILNPVADAMIYNNALNPGEFANGAGQRLFVGTTNSGAARRALLDFDVASVLPADAIVVGVELRMIMDKAASNSGADVSVLQATKGWNAGPTDPTDSGNGDGEGNGAQAVVGDATWLHTNYDTETWIAAGGDFAASVSDTVSVAGNGEYVWSGVGMVADVQAWVNGTFTDFGWMVTGDESDDGTVKRFLSQEAPTEAERPRLVVRYTSAEPCAAEGEGDPEGEPLPPNQTADTDGSESISLSELLRVVQLYNSGRYGCDVSNLEDGYEPFGLDESCGPHDTDFVEGNFVISLTELLRLVQFYNVGDYVRCANPGDSEDGFCFLPV